MMAFRDYKCCEIIGSLEEEKGKEMLKPGCYECKHRRDISGAHSSCAHPKIQFILDDPKALLLCFLGKRGWCRGVDDVRDLLGITANAYGIKAGWFCWPFNFDPIWLESCDGFKQK